MRTKSLQIKGLSAPFLGKHDVVGTLSCECLHDLQMRSPVTLVLEPSPAAIHDRRAGQLDQHVARLGCEPSRKGVVVGRGCEGIGHERWWTETA